MTPRTVSIVFLFAAAAAVSALALALATAFGARLEASLESWIVPLVVFVSFVCVFFLGRTAVLPRGIAASPVQSVLALSIWMAGALAGAWVIAWGARPLMERVGFGSGGLVIFFVCLLMSAALFDRVAAK